MADWIAARAFVELCGDLRLDLFEHLSGHAPSYFAPLRNTSPARLAPWQ